MSIPPKQKVSLIHENSESPDVIVYTEYDSPQISGPKDIIIKNRYSGINFIEVYFRKGVYPGQLPFIFGREATGIVAAVGDEVTKFTVGDAVAYLAPQSFAQYTKVTEDYVKIKKLPSDVTDDQLKSWAGALLQGLTAITLAHEAYEVKPGDFILVWAAAGGVGQLLTQYVTSLGATVIAIASTDEKLAIAKQLGAKYLIRSDSDIPARVREITNGDGVAAVFDSVGKDSFEASLESVARKGTLVSYGNASGVVPPFLIGRLSAKNVKVIRSSLFGYVHTSEEWDHYVDILEKALNEKTLKLSIGGVYPLSEYRAATIALESRNTTGKLILEIP